MMKIAKLPHMGDIHVINMPYATVETQKFT